LRGCAVSVFATFSDARSKRIASAPLLATISNSDPSSARSYRPFDSLQVGHGGSSALRAATPRRLPAQYSPGRIVAIG